MSVKSTSLLRAKMIEDLQIAGLSARTQEAYVRSVRKLAQHYGQSPAKLSEQQIRDYFLFLKNQKQFAPPTLKMAFYGIRFFYTHTVPRPWETLAKLRIRPHKTLPDVLTVDEVRRLIDAVRTPHNRTYLWTVYSLGLRLQEGLHLEVGDIDSARMLVHVHRGKGAKDRYIPLPARILTMLRAYWKTHRNAKLLFPATGRDHQKAAVADTPMGKASVQGAMRRVVLDALEFIRRFLQHVLPSGFQKVRHYGFLSPQSRIGIEAVRWLVALHYGLVFVLLCRVGEAAPPRPKIRCPQCGGALVVRAFVPPARGPPPGKEAA